MFLALGSLIVLPFLNAVVASIVPDVVLKNGLKMPMLAAGSGGYNDTEAYEALSAALSSGFTMVHTSKEYGNQIGVGQAVATVNRENVFLATMVPGCNTSSEDQSPHNCYRSTLEDMHGDLQHLNVSYVDLMFLHHPPTAARAAKTCAGSCEAVRSQWRAVEDFYYAGKAHSIGVSNYCPSCFECLSTARIFPMVNQIQFHVGMGSDPQGFLSYSKSIEVVPQAYSVLAGLPWENDAHQDILYGNLTTSIASVHNVSTAQVAMRWVTSLGVPSIVKSKSPAHQQQDLDLWSWNLTAQDVKMLNEHKSPGASESPSDSCEAQLIRSLPLKWV